MVYVLAQTADGTGRQGHAWPVARRAGAAQRAAPMDAEQTSPSPRGDLPTARAARRATARPPSRTSDD